MSAVQVPPLSINARYSFAPMTLLLIERFPPPVVVGVIAAIVVGDVAQVESAWQFLIVNVGLPEQVKTLTDQVLALSTVLGALHCLSDVIAVESAVADT